MPLFRLLPLVLLLALPGCRDEEFDWRQRITVTVETPAGEVSGFSVQSLHVTKALKGYAGQPPGSHTELRGEAVAVEVAAERYLFLLLEGPDVWLLPSLVRPGLGEYAGYGVRTIEVLRAAGALPTGTVLPIPPDGLPLLVTFDDVADPKTVRRVEPSDLAVSFGPGVALTSVTLEITDEAVTEGRVEEVLGRKPGDGSLDGIWNEISSDARKILSSVNWVRK
ncbi:hypothetical protein G5B31_18110 [Rhodobacter sp. SGA-6-6]|uniref:hypothetical protein n=1 Tax=Rhodobacter sp. SGA-6-6 TaxID=2710882 RepID=UPI0013ED51B8|nr:hypothetical protein [Rhodobacter sp. SGA-6-6]NGM47454.1 hypothetical protein [Rhodobacter sp. SGA-6-6]